MNNLNTLIKLTRDNNITLSLLPLPNNILGYFQKDLDGCYILINQNLEHNIRNYKCILSEEIGHFFTTTYINEPLKHISYSYKIEIDKQEEKAMKWATNYLIDSEILLNYLKNNINSNLENLCDVFDVTENFLKEKLKFMSKQNMYYHLFDNYYLCLYNTSSIYIKNIKKKLDNIY